MASGTRTALLRIVDRKKELIINAAGKNMSPANIEQHLKAASPLVDAKLSRVEQIKRFVLVAEDWQPGGDELTPTMKLKRKPIAAKYADELEALYA